MTLLRATKLSLAPLVALLLGGCLGGLPSPQIVITPRVLAVVADHPESHPGTDVGLHVVAYDPMQRELTYAWRACISLGDLLSSANIPVSLPEIPCIPLASTTADAVVPGALTQAVVDQLGMAADLGGFDPAFLQAVIATAGMSFQVEVDVIAEGTVLITAYKRVGITLRDPVTTNPPVLEYAVGDAAVSMPVEGWTGTGDDCVIWGPPITLAPGEEIAVTPIDDPSTWVETFPILDYGGELTSGTENAYYSFYATAGGLSGETTRQPNPDVTFTAPEEAGPVRLWLVVRDGHLGTRACTFEIDVAP